MGSAHKPGLRLPRGVPLYGFFALPRGLLLKVCAEPCMYAPSYLQSLKSRWPTGRAAQIGRNKEQGDGGGV